MEHLPSLIQDLGLILIAAAMMTLLFKWFNQPIILGYLVAGYFVSSHFPYFPSVNDKVSIDTWSQIGVIFMLFGLGLEFSFKKLFQVGKTAGIAAAFEISAMILIGFTVGRILGWSTINSLFLGATFSISSTTIIVRTFDELGLKQQGFASVVFGILVIEDLIAVLLLVLLSSIAITKTFAAEALLATSCKLGFFLVLWFVTGIYLLPLFLRICRKLLTDEILILVSVGLCMSMVIVSVSVGFSAELGAFVMGSILGETSRGNKIEHVTKPIKDLFSAIFFVSVGMKIDPTILSQCYWIALLMTSVTIIGKFSGVSIGSLIAGCSIKNSTRAGLSMAQVGEFSFIIATLGMSLHVTSDSLYSIVVAVSAITTFTTPYLVQSSDKIANWLQNRVPERLASILLRYEVAMTEQGRENIISLFGKVHGIRILLNSVIVIGITLAIQHALIPVLGNELFDPSGSIAGLIICAITMIIVSPFIWAVFRTKPLKPGNYDVETIAALQRIQFGVTVFRFIIGCFLIGFLISSFTSIHAMSGLVLGSIFGMYIFLYSPFCGPIYHRIENRFVSHLTEKERAVVDARSKHFALAPWDMSLTEFVLSQHSKLVAKTLQKSGLRNQYGVTVAMIERGHERLIPPRGDELLLPFDKIYLLGTEDQLTAVRDVIEFEPENDDELAEQEFGLTSFVASEHHQIIGKTIRDCGLRESINGLIVGIERGGKRHLNPSPEMVLRADDMLWLVGNLQKIADLKKGKTAENLSSITKLR